MMNFDMNLQPKKGKKSDRIVLYAGYTKIEYKLPYEMTRNEIIDKVLKEPEFREKMKEELKEREYRLIIQSL